mmetsp:Transcript_48727/g.90396  ORF Transcript_48727/g.90396 Transcript_48727/m.90396 type:complete len:96 (-) Transcript_48727:234-521(-)
MGGSVTYDVDLNGRLVSVSFSRSSPRRLIPLPSSRPVIKVEVDGVQIHEEKWDTDRPDIVNFDHEGHNFVLWQVGGSGCKRLALVVYARRFCEII